MKPKIIVFSICVFVSVFSIRLQAQSWQWATIFGGCGQSKGTGIVEDNLGNHYIIGQFECTQGFGITPKEYSSTDIFIAKMNSAGKWLWIVSAGGQYVDLITGIVLDNTGHIYVAGSFQTYATIGQHHYYSNGSSAGFVSKLDTAGHWIWTSDAQTDNGNTMALNGIGSDNVGNLYVTGAFTGQGKIGTTTLYGNNASSMLCAKLDTAGKWLWALQGSVPGGIGGNAIAVDDFGNSYITGSFRGEASFGTTTLYSTNTSYLTKITSNGNYAWAIKVDSANGGQSGATCVLADKTGAYIGGYTPFTYNFIARASSAGKWIWTEWPGCTALSFDKAHNINVAGGFVDSVRLGTTSIHTTNYIYGDYIAQMDTTGKWLWALQSGETNSFMNTLGIAASSKNDVAILGYFDGKGEIGGFSYSPSFDGFMARYGTVFTGIDQPVETRPSAKFYPNPFHLSANLSFSPLPGNKYILEIYNMMGAKVSEINNLSSDNQKIEKGNLSEGIYLYRIKDQTGNIYNTGRFIIQ